MPELLRFGGHADGQMLLRLLILTLVSCGVSAEVARTLYYGSAFEGPPHSEKVARVEGTVLVVPIDISV